MASHTGDRQPLRGRANCNAQLRCAGSPLIQQLYRCGQAGQSTTNDGHLELGCTLQAQICRPRRLGTVWRGSPCTTLPARQPQPGQGQPRRTLYSQLGNGLGSSAACPLTGACGFGSSGKRDRRGTSFRPTAFTSFALVSFRCDDVDVGAGGAATALMRTASTRL